MANALGRTRRLSPSAPEAVLPARSQVAVAVATGGALGAAARYGIDIALPHHPGGFPLSTFLINIVGSAALGALLAFLHDRSAHPLLRPFVGGGFLGGFTTFSTYAMQSYGLGDPVTGEGNLVLAGIYLILTPATAVSAAGVGTMLTRRVVDPASGGRVR